MLFLYMSVYKYIYTYTHIELKDFAENALVVWLGLRLTIQRTQNDPNEN